MPVDDAANDDNTSPSTIKIAFTPSRPTDGEFPVGRSGPPITPAMSNPSQIRRGRKLTSITTATQGKLVSSVTDDSTFISLRSLNLTVDQRRHCLEHFLLSHNQLSILPTSSASLSSSVGHPFHRRREPDSVDGHLRPTPPASTAIATLVLHPPLPSLTRLSSSIMINGHDSLDPMLIAMLACRRGRGTITATRVDD
ncbi:hypothetical protein ACLOJK_039237 [Asimina triloba]